MSAPANRTRPLEVMVLDDSAVARQALASVLATMSDVTVSVASHPDLARQRLRRRPPDVLVLDVVMPGTDGLTFLKELMATTPMPVVICSSLGAAADTVVQALQLGAVKVVPKPSFSASGEVHGAGELIEAVLVAAEAKHVPHRVYAPTTVVRPSPAGCGRLVVIGASTGGPQALAAVLSALSPSAPPIAIAQHMPSPFTAAFAAHLARICRIEVKEAEDGDPLVPGRALIGPGGRQVAVVRGSNGYTARLRDDPLVRHRPSADVLFRSAAAAAGRNALGILLTGMGADGAAGLLEMKQAGAITVAQDEESSVVFGMPREAIERGAADIVLPLSRIAGVIAAA